MTADIAGAGSSVMTKHMARRRIAAAVHELRRLRRSMTEEETPQDWNTYWRLARNERAALNEALHTLVGFTLDELREVAP